MPDEFLQINHQVAIPLSELSFRYARSSGPGGQHVQRTETKVELLFDLAGSPSLSEAQRALAMSRLGGRLDHQGVLHLVSQAGRSQLDNRADVMERFRRLLEGKRRRSQAKRLRGRVGSDE